MTALTDAFVPVRPDMDKFEPEVKRKLGAIDTRREGAQVANKFGTGFTGAMGGVAKRTAGLLAGAFAALGAGKFLKDSVAAASDLGETTSKVAQIFGPAAKDVQAFADKAVLAFGQTKQQALDANATFGLFGKSAGLQGKALAGFTTNLTALAGDLASFNNTSPEQAIEAIGAALRGESEPIRSYGVLLDDATLKAEAMSLGLLKASKDSEKIQAANIRASLAQKKYNDAVKEHGKNSSEAKAAEASLITAKAALSKATEGTIGPLTQQQKVLAAQSAILKQTTAAQGDAARTGDQLAGQQRKAAAQMDTLRVAIGTALLPAVLTITTAFNTQLMPPLISLAEKHGPKLASALSDVTTKAGPFIRDFLDKAGPALAGLRDGTSEASPALSSLADSGAKLGPVVQDLVDKVPSLTEALNVGATVIGFFADHTDELSKAMPILVGAVIAYKVAQLAANVAAVAAVPMKVAEVVVNRQLVRSNRELIAARAGVVASTLGETAAQTANNTAKSAGILTTVRLRAAAIAHATATKVIAAGTAIWTGAQWLLNVALTANPIGLLVVGIAALIGIIVLIATKTDWFQRLWKVAWGAIQKAVAFVWNWIKQNWPLLLAILTGPIGLAVLAISKNWNTIKAGAEALWRGIKSAFLTGVRFAWDLMSGFFQDILNGAARMFSWVPGVNDKLAKAATEFGKFRDSVNTKLGGIKDQSVNVTPNIKNVTFQGRTVPLNNIGSFGRFAVGGPVRGPGTGTSDTAGLFALSNGEHVWTAEEVRKAGGHQAMEDMRANIRGMAAGGAVTARPRLPSERGYRVFASEVAAHTRAVARPGATSLAGAIVSSLGLLGPGGPPGSRMRFRGVTLNQRTVRMVLAAERLLGSIFRITQGSYSTRVAASGSTHAGGGALDSNSAGRSWATAVAALRKSGFAAWHRTPAQGPWNHHIHSIAIGDPTASPAAKRQVQAYLRGGNGLGGMARGGAVGDFAQVFDQGGRWRSGTLGVNLSGRTETVVPGNGVMTVRWSDEDRRLMRAVADRPIYLDGKQVDEGLSRRALRGGY